jgi:queuine/archaeosine tRNA-ribosyltransferase
MADARAAIETDRFTEFRREFYARRDTASSAEK